MKSERSGKQVRKQSASEIQLPRKETSEKPGLSEEDEIFLSIANYTHEGNKLFELLQKEEMAVFDRAITEGRKIGANFVFVVTDDVYEQIMATRKLRNTSFSCQQIKCRWPDRYRPGSWRSAVSGKEARLNCRRECQRGGCLL